MAFIGVTKIENGAGGTASASVGTPGAANALIHVGAAYDPSATPTLVVSDTINTWTTHGTSAAPVAGLTTGFASAPNATASATTVQVVWTSGSIGGFTSFIYQFSAVPTSSLLDAVGTNATGGGTTTVSTAAQTNTNANDVFLAVFGDDSGSGTSTVTSTGTGWTQPVGGSETDGTTFLVAGSGYKIVSSAASQTQTWTQTSSSYAARIACFKVNAATQDTPELYGRPYGAHGQLQMQQLLAQ